MPNELTRAYLLYALPLIIMVVPFALHTDRRKKQKEEERQWITEHLPLE